MEETLSRTRPGQRERTTTNKNLGNYIRTEITETCSSEVSNACRKVQEEKKQKTVWRAREARVQERCLMHHGMFPFSLSSSTKGRFRVTWAWTHWNFIKKEHLYPNLNGRKGGCLWNPAKEPESNHIKLWRVSDTIELYRQERKKIMSWEYLQICVNFSFFKVLSHNPSM